MAKQGSVGPSRSGDQFHYQWAARQCLGLLTGAHGLVAVAIEGASLDEGASSTSVGDEVIDVGLYYGSEDVTAAKSIRYVQLKHSSKRAHDPWTASGLKGTIEGFAGRFKELVRIPLIVTDDSGIVTGRSEDRDRRYETVRHSAL